VRLLLRLIANLFRVLLWPLSRLRRAKAAPPGAYIHLELEGAVGDIARESRRWDALFKKPRATVTGLTEVVDAILDDPNPRGLLLTLRSLRLGMATATSLRTQLTRLRNAGREVVVHVPLGADTREYYVACAGTRIYVGPQSSVAPLGFATNARYFRGALEKAGLTPEVFARGTYKSAGETLVRDSMSDAQREQVDALLATFYDELVDAVAEGRHLDLDTARARIDNAPYRAEDAVANALCDAQAYDDEVRDALDGKIVPAAAYVRARKGGHLLPLRAPEIIGVIPFHGPIASTSPFSFGVVTEEPLVQMVRRARRDPKVRAVVLHIESPGGSALVSDRIHHELVRLAAVKPLVACMANVAASGGYYVAAPAHVIVAEPTTVTGSIGVVAARFTADPLMAKLGIRTESLRRGQNAGLLDSSGPLSEAERDALLREIEGVYRGFVQVVADGRKRSVDEVHAVAEGRVWVGRDAREKGLVDELGGFDRALSVARQRGADGRKLMPVLVKPPRTPLAILHEDREERRQQRIVGALGSTLEMLNIDLASLLLTTTRERVLAWFDLGHFFGR
jgi:protease-4